METTKLVTPKNVEDSRVCILLDSTVDNNKPFHCLLYDVISGAALCHVGTDVHVLQGSVPNQGSKERSLQGRDPKAVTQASGGVKCHRPPGSEESAEEDLGGRRKNNFESC